MGRRAGDETIEIHEGVYLRLKGGAYHCYFRLGGKQFRRSTKTGDLAAAKLKALTWFQDAQTKHNKGEEIERVSFARLKRSYLDQIKGQGKHAYHAATIERHLLPFFSRFDDISKIRRTDVLDYLRFRRAQGEAAPAPQTINRENTVLRQMLRHGVDRGWLRASVQIDNESERLTRRRRRHFTIEEYRKLHRVARKRARELDGIELKTRQGRQRKLLYDVVLLIANTGLRVDEVKTVIWRNVDFNDASILLEHAGKTRSTRRVLMRKSAVDALNRIRQRRLDYLARHGGSLDLNERIVALPNGVTVASFKKGFDQLLATCGFEYGSAQDKHVLTSLRHTYATFRLTKKTGKRASVRSLAKQMGTSERMIERHYGHDVVDDYRDELID
jgi:integrase